MTALTEALARDRARSRVLEMSSFGIVQITRRRGRLPLDRALLEGCPTCRGSGRVKSPRTIVQAIQRALASRAGATARRSWTVRVHPSLIHRLEAASLGLGESSEADVRLKADSTLSPGRYAIEPADAGPDTD